MYQPLGDLANHRGEILDETSALRFQLETSACVLRIDPGSLYSLPMTKPFPKHILRSNLPRVSSFHVAEIAHTAKLDQNESPFDIPPDIKRLLAEKLLSEPWNRYPQPKQYLEVKERFAGYFKLKPEQVIITVGCDQMILLAYWAAGGPGRVARIFEPTYPIYASLANTTQTQCDRAVLGPDFDLEANGIGSPVDLLFLVSPNNPTGQGPRRDFIEQALDRDCLVFVDEAYFDYSEETVVDLVDVAPNLIVARSLSKASLAGVRLGFGVGHPELISVLEKTIFAPYHLNAMQLLIAKHFDLILPHLRIAVKAVREERDRMAAELKGLGFRVWPSQANFLLFEVDKAQKAFDLLINRGVRIRDVSSLPGMGEHLRVTVGSPLENNCFLNALRAL